MDAARIDGESGMQALATAKTFRQCPLFAGLDRDALAQVAERCAERRFLPRQRIISEGVCAGEAELHIVAGGIVRVFKRSLDGRELVLGLMHPGDTFGEAAVFDGGPYPANADALEPSVVFTLPATAVWDLVRTYPSFAEAALRLMAGRLRQMTTMAEDLALRRVMSRVAKLLLTDADAAHLTQTQLAAMVGSTREVVNRSLHALASCGAIDAHGQTIVVLDAEQLRLIARAG